MKIMKKDERKISIDFSIHIYGVLELIYFSIYAIIYCSCLSVINYLSSCIL